VARKSAPWFKCFPEDWLVDTRKLTLEQRGAYFDVLCLLYARDGKLYDDDVELAHKLRVHWRTWRSIKGTLVDGGFLSVNKGLLKNRRAHKVLRERAEMLQKVSKTASEREQKRRRIAGNTDKLGIDVAAPCQGAASLVAQDPPISKIQIQEKEDIISLSDKRETPATVHRFVSEAALDRVRSVAPGWDRQMLLRRFLDWPESKSARDMDAAFLGWAKKYTKGKAPGGAFISSGPLGVAARE
jgi:uncharacterized protein YdaU (DUF1376 family)